MEWTLIRYGLIVLAMVAFAIGGAAGSYYWVALITRRIAIRPYRRVQRRLARIRRGMVNEI